jgi:exodeoxyribonuclease V alpha subunit
MLSPEPVKIHEWNMNARGSNRGAASYFSSSKFPGVGSQSAQKIIKHFGNPVFRQLLKYPSRINEVEGIKDGQRNTISQFFSDLSAGDKCVKENEETIFALLCSGLTELRSQKVFKDLASQYRNKDGVVKAIRENPYLLIRVSGIGFRKADDVAKFLGFKASDPVRIQAAILHVLGEIAWNEGHCRLRRLDLIDRAYDLLKIKGEEERKIEQWIENAIIELAKSNQVSLTRRSVALKWLKAREEKAARIITSISGAEEFKVERKRLQRGIKAEEKKEHIDFTDEQEEAVEIALSKPMSVITGCPGTGKSTICKGIVSACKASNIELALACPTGRARKRLQDIVGHPASTIHRLLGWTPLGFTYNEHNKLPADMVLIDESSMVDVILFCHLLDAIAAETSLVLVGDVDQLPSVGPGNVLRDIIESKCCPVTWLTRIFRHKKGSDIAENARRVNRGKLPHMKYKNKGYAFVETKNRIEIPDTVAEVYEECIEKYGIDGVQVLTPMHDGPAGTRALNAMLQDVANPDGRQTAFRSRDYKFRIGDRIMFTRNDYKHDVFNGDIGIFENTEVIKGKPHLRIRMDGGIVDYPAERSGQIEPGWAITCHKCLTPDTRIWTSSGMISIGSFGPISNVSSQDLKQAPRVAGETNEERPSRFHSTGWRKCMKIQTKDGYIVKCTPDHKLFVIDEQANLQAKKACDIEEGDQVVLVKGANLFGALRNLPDQISRPIDDLDVRAVRYKHPRRMSPDLAKFLGYMVADGTVYRTGIRFTKRYREVTQDFADVVYRLFGYRTDVKLRPSNDYAYEISSTYISQFCKRIGGIQPNEKHVPEIILRSSKKCQIAFLSALFEDGSVNLKHGKLDHIEWSSASKQLARDVKLMLLNMGIVTRTYTQPSEERLFIYSDNAKRFREMIGFVSNSKQEKLSSPIAQHPRTMIIKEIKDFIRMLVKRWGCGNVPKQTVNSAIRQDSFTISLLSRILSHMNEAKDEDVRRLKSLIKNLHIDQIASVREQKFKSPTCCIEMPQSHRFAQNGFLGSNSQGGQYPAVICVASTEHYIILDRHLLYTAMTRAEERLLLIGIRKAVYIAANQDKSIARNTSLKPRIVRARKELYHARK